MYCGSGLFKDTRILVTGAAGFIGFHVARRLLAEGAEVLGLDNFSPYYDVSLKHARIAQLADAPGFTMATLDLADAAGLGEAWSRFQPQIVLHLAAQAGVRFSIEHPEAYVASNIVGTFNLLEQARRRPPRHLLIASTSSVYGAGEKLPYEETHPTNRPLTLYAASKGATELIGHSYAHLFELPTTFFRFFTVYGPWGRPDMAPMKFAEAMLSGRPIDVYNYGEMSRDFTFIDDLVEAVSRLLGAPPQLGAAVAGDTLSPVAPFRVVNIGPGQPVMLGDFIETLESALGIVAVKRHLPRQPGDPLRTEASSALLRTLTGYAPSTPISEGVPQFAEWFVRYRNGEPGPLANAQTLELAK